MTIQEEIQVIENNSNATFGCVTRVLKKHCYFYKKHRCSHLFWESSLPVKFLSEFESNNWLLELLLGYFSSPTNQNTVFIKQVAKNYPEDLVKSIKLSQVFYDDNWFERLSGVLDTNFLKEITYLRKLSKKWEQKASIHKNTLAQISHKRLFETAISKLEEIKNSSAILQNRNLLMKKEMNFCYAFNDLLNHKKDRDSDINDTISDEKIADVITFFNYHHSFKRQIEMYCAGYADCITRDVDYMKMETNESYSIHRANEDKLRFQERLAINKSMLDNQISTENIMNILKYGTVVEDIVKNITNILLEYFVGITVETNLQYFEYLKMPSVYTWRGHQIEIKKVFELLAEMNKLAGSEVLFIQNEKQLTQILALNLSYSEVKTKLIIDFLTTDLSEPNKEEINLLYKPFIKIDNQYFWLKSLLKDRRWDFWMHIRLSNENLYQTNKPSEDIEIALSQVFKNNEFDVPPQFLGLGKESKKKKKFKLSDGRAGEIDVLALKNGILFLIEIKTTSLGEGLVTHAKYNSQTFEFKASQQLDDAKQYVEESKFTTEFKEKFGFGGDEIKEIKTLIVSNIFEQDGIIVNKKHLKISLFGLLVILNNDFEIMLNICGKPFYQFEKNANMNDPYFRQGSEMHFPVSFNLWSGSECSANDLIDAINENKIWNFLDKMYDFSKSETIELTTFENFNKNWLG